MCMINTHSNLSYYIMNKESKKRFTMLMTAGQKRELRVIAALHNRTMTEFVDQAIRNEIKRLTKR